MMTNDEHPLVAASQLRLYCAGLDAGDFETVAAVLEIAERSPLLEQMIIELHQRLSAELELTLPPVPMGVLH